MGGMPRLPQVPNRKSRTKPTGEFYEMPRPDRRAAIEVALGRTLRPPPCPLHVVGGRARVPPMSTGVAHRPAVLAIKLVGFAGWLRGADETARCGGAGLSTMPMAMVVRT